MQRYGYLTTGAQSSPEGKEARPTKPREEKVALGKQRITLCKNSNHREQRTALVKASTTVKELAKIAKNKLRVKGKRFFLLRSGEELGLNTVRPRLCER